MSLVGTGDVREWLNIPISDYQPNAKISTLISAVEKYIEQYCSRKFEAQLFETHPDYCYFDGTGAHSIWLPVYPIWRVDEVRIDNDRDFTDSGTLVSTNGEDLIIYPTEGKVTLDTSSSFGSYARGRRNVRFKYYAGYGTGSYPIPGDLKQVIIEMVVQAFNEGITGIHTVMGQQESKIMRMLSGRSFWTDVLNSYKNYSIMTGLNRDVV